MLSTKCKDGTGRILAQGLDRIDQTQRSPYKKKGFDIFPERSWASFITGDLLHDWKIN